MENDILDSLEDLGYDGPLLDERLFSESLTPGANSVAYTQLVEWAISQLASFYNIDAKVSAIQEQNDSEHFLMELSGFLREFACPYNNLTEGPIDRRLATKNACLQLLDFLLTELAGAKLLAVKKPFMLADLSHGSVLTEKNESEIAKHLKRAWCSLKIPKPPGNITSFELFSQVEKQLKTLMSQYPDQAGKSLLKSRWSDQQWAQILEINDYLLDEYRVRREMLLKRLDVTIQSFKWSEKAKNNENKIAEVYQPIRTALSPKTVVGISHILAARDDLTTLQKTSSGEARERTKCAINKILIGQVPDRGGRAWELEPPPPEMPAFTKRDPGSQGGRGKDNVQERGGGGRGGRGGRGGGGRVQGGWGDSQSVSLGGNWNQGGGSSRGGYQQGGYQQEGRYQQGSYSHGGGYQQGAYASGGGSSRGGQDTYSQGGYQSYNNDYQNQDAYHSRDEYRGRERGRRERH